MTKPVLREQIPRDFRLIFRYFSLEHFHWFRLRQIVKLLHRRRPIIVNFPLIVYEKVSLFVPVEWDFVSAAVLDEFGHFLRLPGFWDKSWVFGKLEFCFLPGFSGSLDNGYWGHSKFFVFFGSKSWSRFLAIYLNTSVFECYLHGFVSYWLVLLVDCSKFFKGFGLIPAENWHSDFWSELRPPFWEETLAILDLL